MKLLNLLTELSSHPDFAEHHPLCSTQIPLDCKAFHCLNCPLSLSDQSQYHILRILPYEIRDPKAD